MDDHFQLVDIPFTGGISQATPAELLAPPKLVYANNAQWTRGGQLEKRPGFDKLARSCDYATGVGTDGLLAGVRLARHGDELILIDGQYIHKQNKLSPGTQWIRLDMVSEFTEVNRFTCSEAFSAATPYSDVGYYGGRYFVVRYFIPWAGATPVYRLEVFDATTRALLYAGQLNSATAAALPVVIVVDDTDVVAFYGVTSGGHTCIAARKCDAAVSVSAWEAEVILTSDVQINVYDACVVNDSHIVVAWSDTHGDKIYVERRPISSLSTREYLEQVYTKQAKNDIGVRYAPLEGTKAVYIAFYSEPGELAEGVLLAKHTAADCTPIWLAPVVIAPDDTHVHNFAIECYASWVMTAWTMREIDYGPWAMSTLRWRAMRTDGTPYDAFIGTHTNLDVASRTWCESNGQTYLMCRINRSDASDVVVQLCTNVVSDVTYGHRRVVASANTRINHPEMEWREHAASVWPVSSIKDGTILSRGEASGDNDIQSVEFMRSGANGWQSPQVDEELLIAGGFLQSFDGQRVGETCPFWAPHDFTVDDIAGGSLTADETYYFSVRYELRDSLGVLHASEAAAPKAVATTEVNKTARLLIPTLSVTNWEDEDTRLKWRVAIYQTVAGGTVLYRQFEYEATPSGLLNRVDDGTGYISYDVTTEPVTDKGILDTAILQPQQPHASVDVCAINDRVWCVDTETNRIWYSLKLMENEAPTFNDMLVFRLIAPDRIVAMRALDEKYIIFTDRAIWVMVGDGPSDSGMNSDFSTPQCVSSETGCLDWRSIVESPSGLMFQGPLGIWHLSRSLSLTFVGADVMDHLASYPVITSARYIAQYHQVRFTCTNAGTTLGMVLVFDTLFNQWTTTIISSGGPATLVPAIDSMYIDSWYMLRTDAYVYKQATHYSDPDLKFIQMLVRTPWIKLASLQGWFQAMRGVLLARCVSQHDLNIKIYADYDSSTVRQTFTKNYGQIAAMAAFPREQCQFAIRNQQLEALMVEVYDSQYSVVYSSAGLVLLGLTLELSKENGRARLPSSEVMAGT